MNHMDGCDHEGDTGCVISEPSRQCGQRMLKNLLVLAQKVQGMMNAGEITSAVDELRQFGMEVWKEASNAKL